jgi:predicted nucleic acid-binding protein
LKKIKVYLDTSTISHLYAEDVPEKESETNLLWEDFIMGKYDIYISQVVLTEIQKCSEPKRAKMLRRMREIEFTVLNESDEVEYLANEYIKAGVLKAKSSDDCFHIAYAVINNCDVIVSWNFKHLVNFRTIDKVRVVNAINRYKEIGIISPNMLLEEVDEE